MSRLSEPELPTLTLVGVPSTRARAAVAAGLRAEADALETTCFASFAPVTFPVGTVFEVIFASERPDVWAPTECELMAVTQEFGRRWTEIPAGWRTICVLRFPQGVPDLVRRLPLIDSWSQGVTGVGLRAKERTPHR